MNKETKVKPPYFKCKRCGKVFLSTRYLRTKHLKGKGKKPKQCPYCHDRNWFKEPIYKRRKK